jgi:formate-dependent nitrite reductase membrane component NrfD
MIENRNLINKLIALTLAFIGVAAMVFAWFVLLTTATHNTKIVAIEIGGVVFTIIGYLLWQYSNRSCQNLEIEEMPQIEEEK